MSRANPRERKKWEMNSEPRSQVTWDRTPCLENTCIMNNLASSGASISSTVGMKMPCLVRRSTMTRIAVWPSDSGRCSMKSMDMEFHGSSGTGNCFRSPYGLCHGAFECLQVVQELQKCFTMVRRLGHTYFLLTSSMVLFCPKC